MVPTELTPDIVRLAYRLFLGREPESEWAIEQALSYKSVEKLRAAFFASEELRGVLGRVVPQAQAAPQLVRIDAPPLDVEWQATPDAAAALLAHVRSTWTRLGHECPHWSVLSAKPFTPEQIGQNEPAFFASGARDRDDVLAILRRHGVAPADVSLLFEFGCGVGRVTAHLAGAFGAVAACDVSPSHLAMAREVVSASGARNATFFAADAPEFGMTGAFDVWFSRIVLQHNPPPIMAMILRRAFALLAPGGLAIFQVPTYAKGYSFRLDTYLRGLDGPGQIEMHVLPQPVVFALAREAGCEPLEVLEDMSAGPSVAWNSTTFVLRKPPATAGSSLRDTNLATP